MSPKAVAPVWLFDLDNTLHDARPNIFPHINRSMVAYIRAHLGLDEDRATRLREDYWQRYGATLLGLVRHHGTEPHHFLEHTHRFDDLGRMLVFEPALKLMLRRLVGRKLIFSNAPLDYTYAILDRMGIRNHFAAVYSIERLRFQPKPAPAAFRCLLRAESLRPAQCIMVEDSLANLRVAKRLGMQTVWVSSHTRQPAWVDRRLTSILDLRRHRAPL
ncbi:MAG: pyrimidine 5'-nucleotidase [Candidatus Accumulibacter sp.]|uniref:pyrimidine 5'-nucleotidase n=1 Tax=Accumulibacter sp. TaxID=2053492 RepID=UPI002878F0F5|nr:pyrimidine 5'-nucleotidase [Accumulibacter sp.]MDS4016155.1 pyrimidine 5'-nucleotidase [Accumulibacter sp.]